ncbi:hypothetical protein FOCC_FOCC000275 [Frankliniella occidentalis]|nr:hypothetical protein FOCC_FOCC000275 [Frankliniella occidentalis]
MRGGPAPVQFQKLRVHVRSHGYQLGHGDPVVLRRRPELPLVRDGRAQLPAGRVDLRHLRAEPARAPGDPGAHPGAAGAARRPRRVPGAGAPADRRLPDGGEPPEPARDAPQSLAAGGARPAPPAPRRRRQRLRGARPVALQCRRQRRQRERHRAPQNVDGALGRPAALPLQAGERPRLRG